MKKYVLGFLFDDYCNNVVFIRKNKPEWQAGLLNGIGGKIELGEHSSQAMIREGFEEMNVTPNWRRFVRMRFNRDAMIWCFAASSCERFEAAHTVEQEEVVKRSVKSIVDHEIIPNIKFLLPMAQHFLLNKQHHPRLSS